MTTGTD
jgi:hypothetical protein